MTLTRGLLLSHPKIVIHLCFLLVFLFSTTLTWREMLVLKASYEVSQSARLNTTANTLERQWQRSVDELYFFRSMFQHAIQSPVDNGNIRQQLTEFTRLRNQPVWRLGTRDRRSITLNGISDAEIAAWPLLNRDDSERLHNELVAAMEMSFILQLNDPERNFHSRLWYISRAGFFLSSTPPLNDSNLLKSYQLTMNRPYFTRMEPETNPDRERFWSGAYASMRDEGMMLTTSIPVDWRGYWYGVLAMDFSAARIAGYLRQSLSEGEAGNVLLYDSQLRLVAQTDRRPQPGHQLHAETLSQLKQAMKENHQGVLRAGTRFISWVKHTPSHGVLVNVETLREGMQGDIGRVTLVLMLMWLLFSLVLLLSHQAIVRLVGKMLTLQDKLSWRAHYDGLTGLFNRVAFFDITERQALLCQKNSKSFSVIQLDLDRFKQVNDTWGHQAGDRVLSHAAAILAETVRKTDSLGRIGGEEFCIGLPDTGKAEAIEIAERVRKRLAQQPVPVGKGKTLNITASLGVASSDEQGDYLFENLQSVADRRLYLAKAYGRNRVCGEEEAGS